MKTAAALVALALLLSACGGEDEEATGRTDPNELALVGYPGLASVYEDAIEPAFEATRAGKGISFTNSFGDSGDQRRAVADGLPASIVHFEHVGHMERLVEEGLVDADWDEQSFLVSGVPHWTVIVFVVRRGNPKQVRTVRDLLRDDVDVVVPDPFASDTGRWSVVDVYATLLDEGRSEAKALAAVKELLEKAVSQPQRAAEGLDAFLRGEGDVLLAYESQAIQALEAGKDLRFVVPYKTIRVETVVAVTENAPEPAARHFLKFLWSGTGQQLWAEAGYRPADQWFQARFKERFPFRETLSIVELGGWAEVDDKLFGEGVDSIKS